MKTLFTTLSALICLSAFSQKKNINNYQKLQTTYAFINYEAGMNYIYGSDPRSVAEIQPSTVVLSIRDSLKSKSNDPWLKYMKKYSPALIDYYNSINKFGETSGVFDEEGLPFCFTEQNNSLAFVQACVFSKYTYNSVKVDADERARLATKNILLPSLSNFETLTKIPEIRYFALVVGYKVQDFTESNALADGETTAIIIPRQLLLDYINSKVTDAEVMKRAMFYNKNKNSSNIRKLSF
ncbi:MAG TPA: hypothetical protein VL442_13350 [Mucilaginibacter sp.]|jgi:hypothetical protein|nr:hypothetical protein [Mucilaginibacter sp.]